MIPSLNLTGVCPTGSNMSMYPRDDPLWTTLAPNPSGSTVPYLPSLPTIFTSSNTLELDHEDHEVSECFWSYVNIEFVGVGITIFAAFNCLLNLYVLHAFWKICQASRRAQMIHYLLFYLTILEAGYMSLMVTKDILYRFQLDYHPHRRTTSIAQIYVRFYGTLLVQVLSSTLNAARNYWIVLIAMFRWHALMRLRLCSHQTSSSHVLPVPGRHKMDSGYSLENRRRLRWYFVGILLLHLGIATGVYHAATYNSTIQVCLLVPSVNTLIIQGHQGGFSNRSQLDWFHESVFFLIPFISMLVADLGIIVCMQRLMRHTTNQRFLHFQRVTRTIFILVFTFILLEAPFTVCNLLLNNKALTECDEIGVKNFGLYVADFLVVLNASVNIVIYYYWEQVFQKYVRAHVFRRRVNSTSIANDTSLRRLTDTPMLAETRFVECGDNFRHHTQTARGLTLE